MSVSGQFGLHYSWGCTGSYSTNTVTFNADGTFADGSGGAGRWSQTNGNIIWRYNGDSAIYAGVVNGGAIVGNMVNFASAGAGCFYASKATTSAAATESDLEPSGEKKKKK
jgi:hypothetical protein